MSEHLTITLTGRPPVRITREDWPIVASYKEHDGEVESQALRHSKLIVRQHEDGQTIVYGIYDTAWQNESGRRRGEMLDAKEDIPAAIARVAEEMEFGRDFAENCIADLPAEEV